MPPIRFVTSLLFYSLFFFYGAIAKDEDKWLSPVYKDFFSVPLPIPPEATPKYSKTINGNTVNYYEIEIKPLEQQIYPGLKKARLVGYNGVSPGPTFRMERGTEAVVRFVNTGGDRASSIHLHGSYSRVPWDGWAEDVTPPGSYKDYYYPNRQAGRTLWYHDHAVHHTAENAYYGQAGFYILHDPAEDKYGLPSGKYDVPLALTAKRYNADGTLWDPEANNELVSVYGDVFHVNGQPWPYMNVEPRKYRFRILNAAISRTYKYYFEDDSKVGTKIPYYVIGSDAGLLERPVQATEMEHSMAERWELVFDFSGFAGKNVTWRNNRDVEQNDDFAGTDRIMRFVVGTTKDSSVPDNALPSTFKALPFPAAGNTIDHDFVFERNNGEWRINGVAFADVNNRVLAQPQQGNTETWLLENKSGGWAHPIHIHLVDFQILERFDGKRGVEEWEKVALKDVVLLGLNEKVKVRAVYAPWEGLYMFHCHNLIHEDHDMMAAFNVTLLENLGYKEKVNFIDPMEQRWRSRPITASEFTQDYIVNTLIPRFVDTEAYSKAEELEAALSAYWKTATPGSTRTSTVTGTTLVTSARTTTNDKSSSTKTTTTRATTTKK